MIQYVMRAVAVIIVVVLSVIVGFGSLKSYIGTEPDTSKRKVRFAGTKHVRGFVKSTREWKGDEYTAKV